MPTYDYRCDVCENVLEITHRMDETYEGDVCNGLTCPTGRLRKQFTPTPAIFRGSGWARKPPTK